MGIDTLRNYRIREGYLLLFLWESNEMYNNNWSRIYGIDMYKDSSPNRYILIYTSYILILIHHKRNFASII